MINTVIAYDDNDQELGDYFEECFQSLNIYLSQIDDVKLFHLTGLECTEDNLIETINLFDEDKFVFVALTHGNDAQLLTDNDILVDLENIDHLKLSLFYTTACDSAIKLGPKLIQNDCLSYVGYNQISFSTYEDYNQIYINCETYCLREFLNSNLTLENCFNNMLEYFDQQIGLLSIDNDEILVAMELINNRDAFRILGNGKLTKNNLED